MALLNIIIVVVVVVVEETFNNKWLYNIVMLNILPSLWCSNEEGLCFSDLFTDKYYHHA